MRNLANFREETVELVNGDGLKMVIFLFVHSDLKIFKLTKISNLRLNTNKGLSSINSNFLCYDFFV